MDETRRDETRREENELYCFQGGEAGEHVSNSNKYCLQFQVKGTTLFSTLMLGLNYNVQFLLNSNQTCFTLRSLLRIIGEYDCQHCILHFQIIVNLIFSLNNQIYVIYVIAA